MTAVSDEVADTPIRYIAGQPYYEYTWTNNPCENLIHATITVVSYYKFSSSIKTLKEKGWVTLDIQKIYVTKRMLTLMSHSHIYGDTDLRHMANNRTFVLYFKVTVTVSDCDLFRKYKHKILDIARKFPQVDFRMPYNYPLNYYTVPTDYLKSEIERIYCIQIETMHIFEHLQLSIRNAYGDFRNIDANELTSVTNGNKLLDIYFTQEQYDRCKHFFGDISKKERYNYGIVIVPSWTSKRHQFLDVEARNSIVSLLAATQKNLCYDMQIEVLNYL